MTTWGGNDDPAINVYQWFIAIAEPHPGIALGLPSVRVGADAVPAGAATLWRADGLYAGHVLMNKRAYRHQRLDARRATELRALAAERLPKHAWRWRRALKAELVALLLDTDPELQALGVIADQWRETCAEERKRIDR